jgi:hypothetical protein
LLERFIFVSADAYLSPFLGGKYLILLLNNFAKSRIEYDNLLEIL